ncbi:MAG: thioredoxin family protein [Candidatus Hodarchaeales archaeon]|jgi:thiol-disulfide isomerase/thioredoxin
MGNKATPTIQELKLKGKSLNTYLEETKDEWGEIVSKIPLKPAIDDLFHTLSQKDYILLIFSASWCKDCKLHLPEVSKIQESLLKNHSYELEAIVISGLKFDSLNPNNTWKIPPTPEEVSVFNIVALPTLILIDKSTNMEIGRITEHPQQKDSIEEELVFLLQK